MRACEVKSSGLKSITCIIKDHDAGNILEKLWTENHRNCAQKSYKDLLLTMP
jgi:hypothetical protein